MMLIKAHTLLAGVVPYIMYGLVTLGTNLVISEISECYRQKIDWYILG